MHDDRPCLPDARPRRRSRRPTAPTSPASSASSDGRPGAPLPDAVRAELDSRRLDRRSVARAAEQELESAQQLPVAVESWDAFDALYAWDERPLRAGRRWHVCATYLGAAVRSFFAARRPPRAHRARRRSMAFLERPRGAATRQRIRALVPSFADPGRAGARSTPTDPRTWRGIEHLYGLADVSLALLPDLADACAIDPAAPAVRARTAGAARRLRRMQRRTSRRRPTIAACAASPRRAATAPATRRGGSR